MSNKNFGTLTNHDDINENDSAYINDDIDEYLTRSHLTLVGWDKFRTHVLIILIILFIIWAFIYFPIMKI